MSVRKTLKELRKHLPNLSEEQTDAFDKFYKETPQDAFKTFNKEEEFNNYIDQKILEKTQTLENQVKEYKQRDKLVKLDKIKVKFTLNDKQKTILDKLTDLSEIKEDDQFEKNVENAYQKTIKQYEEIFVPIQVKKDDPNAKQQISTNSSDIFGKNLTPLKTKDNSKIFD